jgi:RimJ/RimL family protein N-acetyltransferase
MSDTSLQTVEIKGYYPGVLGRVITQHAHYYHKHWGFDYSFETEVAAEIAQFRNNFDGTRDGIWVALKGDRFVGSISLDGFTTPQGKARIRWFIVSEAFQGLGVGSKLMKRAVRFGLSAGYEKLFLYTFQGLERARRLYEKNGFKLIKEQETIIGGVEVNGQKLELSLLDSY